jgi:flagellar FliL protein
MAPGFRRVAWPLLISARTIPEICMATSKKEPAKAPAEGAPKSGKGKMIALILGAVVVLAGVGGGVAWFLVGKQASATEASEDKEGKEGKKGKKGKESEEGEDGEAAKKVATYLSLDPAFVVNLAGPDSDRYLRVSVELMTRDPLAADTLKLHMPAIRNSLLLLFGQQTAEALAGRDGREGLRQAALTEVQKVMQEETGDDAVEALYFTSFVTQ